MTLWNVELPRSFSTKYSLACILEVSHLTFYFVKLLCFKRHHMQWDKDSHDLWNGKVQSHLFNCRKIKVEASFSPLVGRGYINRQIGLYLMIYMKNKANFFFPWTTFRFFFTLLRKRRNGMGGGVKVGLEGAMYKYHRYNVSIMKIVMP